MSNTSLEMATIESRPCPVCGTATYAEWRWTYLEVCSHCGHVRKTSNIEDVNVHDIQKNYFKSGFALQDDIFTHLYERLNVRRRMREVAQIIKGGRALEVGVGRGSMLAALKAKGYQVEGIDLSDAVCSAIQARYGIPVYQGTVESYADATVGNTFDIILMCHVLEHIESLGRALRAVKHLLKPQGILYVAVPNISCWNARFPGWTGFEPYHVHYFRANNLRRVLESADFRVQSEKTFEPISGWFNTIVRSVRTKTPDIKSRTDAYPCDDAVRHGFIWSFYNLTRLATGIILSPFRWIQSARGYGEELIIIAQAK